MTVKVITSLSQADGRGLWIYFLANAAATKLPGTGRAVMVCNAPWGPVSTLTDIQRSGELFRQTFYPNGSDHTKAPYVVGTRFPWVDLWVTRVTGSGAAKATKVFNDAVSAASITVTGKYLGVLGNSINVTIAAATNGVANSFNMTLTLTNASTGKSTTEFYPNVDSTQAVGAAYWTTLTANSILVGPITRGVGVRPANCSATPLATGSDGTINAASYVGTPGAGDTGIASVETDPTVSIVFIGEDVTSASLATVNAALKAHRLLMNDTRICLLTGDAGDAVGTANTNAALNQDPGCYYVWPYGKVRDEDATSDSYPQITIPLVGPLASFVTILAPHLSPAYKNRTFTSVFSPVLSLDASSFNLNSAEASGVLPFEKNKDGVFSPYGSTATDGTSSFEYFRMQRYIAFAVANAFDEFRGGPNDSVQIDDERELIKGVLSQLVANRKQDHIFLPSVIDAGLLPVEQFNTPAQIAAGDITHAFQAQLVPEQKRIFFAVDASTSTKVQVSLIPNTGA